MKVALCRELVVLAKREDEAAAAEACQVPYWLPFPSSVEGHRTAARILRRAAKRLEAQGRELSDAG